MAGQGNKTKQDINFLTKGISYLTFKVGKTGLKKGAPQLVPGTIVQIK